MPCLPRSKEVAVGRNSDARWIRAWVVVAALACVSCDLSSLWPHASSIVEQTATALNDAIAALQSESADWQQVLKDLEKKLTADAQATIRNEIDQLVSRTVAHAGVEFRCDADFIRHRVREDLVAIKARLLGALVPPKRPALCQVVPETIDASIVPQQLKFLGFYGYNFDFADRLRARILNADASAIDVTGKLDRPTPYAMTLAFGGSGVQLDARNQRVVLEWNDLQVSSVAIIQPQAAPPAVCASKVVPVFAREADRDIGWFIPPRVHGDAEFAGHGPDVRASVTLTVTPTLLLARVYMDAKEIAGDTEAEGWHDFSLLRAESGWRIDRVEGATNSSVHYVDSNTDPDFRKMGPADLIERYEFIGDTSGDEAGTRTGVMLHFNQVFVTESQITNCVSSTAFRAALLAGFISPATRTMLEAKVGDDVGRRRAQLATLINRPQ